jgi:UDP-GlcNAc:undecaprenyl-phosphate/decaprenyl-phosphate GlcNAc-1-phosphate transferase
LILETSHWIAMAVVFATALIAALILTPWAQSAGVRWGIMAIPGGRRQHRQPIPRTGGIALFGAFALAIIVAQFLPVERTDPNEIIRFFGLLLGAGIIFGLGLLDDKYDLSAVILAIGQIIAAGVAVFCLIFIKTFNNPFTGHTTAPFPFVVTVIISLFWLGLMMNTVNFLDGADGLAAGVTCIAALMIFIHAAFRLDQVSVGLLALALVGATLGFLPYNFQPARIYMGSGAYVLGYALGVLSIIGGAKMATVLLVMGLPLMDLAWQAGSRLLRGKNPMVGDRGHLHFRLIDAGVPHRVIALGYYAFCGCFGLIALTTTSQLFKLLTIAVMGLMVVSIFIIVSLKSPKIPIRK